jgi:F-type H+-transporting ATPase subunit epsilon
VATTHVELVAPSRNLYSGDADMLVCRTAGGDIAFLANHAPYLGVLEPGLVRVIPESGEEVRLAVHGGFVAVRDNQVTLLADVAEMADEIDVERARRAKADAEQRVNAAAEGDAEAEADLRRAEVRLEVSGAT